MTAQAAPVWKTEETRERDSSLPRRVIPFLRNADLPLLSTFLFLSSPSHKYFFFHKVHLLPRGRGKMTQSLVELNLPFILSVFNTSLFLSCIRYCYNNLSWQVLSSHKKFSPQYPARDVTLFPLTLCRQPVSLNSLSLSSILLASIIFETFIHIPW